MAGMTVKEMLDQMDLYFAKIEKGGGGSKTVYKTGKLAKGATVVIDAPAELDFTVAKANIYSTGVDLKMQDIDSPTPIKVIPAVTALDYVIGLDGKITIRNFANGEVTYHVRLTAPVNK